MAYGSLVGDDEGVEEETDEDGPPSWGRESSVE
jgi:hypothetical protein